uniref:Ribosomal protein eL8/eL30/eS12/Gadd45 domain-containing protein n=1 Tax=Marmota marmota marmota TaxID=9994 RepID=A0A8C5ZMR4_MARMA
MVHSCLLVSSITNHLSPESKIPGNFDRKLWSCLYSQCWRYLLKAQDRMGIQQSFTKKHKVERCSLGVDTSEDLKNRPEANQQVSGWTPVQIRKQLAIGVNEVTRALERSELLLVLVCKSVKPAIITSHLIQLSVSRVVPACQVPCLSATLAPVIGLKCVLALGFKKDTTDFVDEVRAIIPRVPSLTVPWLQDRIENIGDNLETESLGIQDKETLETSFEDLSKHKRKLEGQQVSVALQPLKIKKLIPNPNKIRKPPKSKKNTSK